MSPLIVLPDYRLQVHRVLLCQHGMYQLGVDV